MKKIFCLISALILFNACTVWHAVTHGRPDVFDYNIFPQETIRKGDTSFNFVYTELLQRKFDTLSILTVLKKQKGSDSVVKTEYTLKDFLALEKGSSSFMIIHNDTIKYENYCGKFDKNSVSTVFSVSKSLTSLLCGIAIDQGYIKSIGDPVTDYLPELKKCDPMFEKLTIEHLLDMRACIKFPEDYSINPFSRIAYLHYGRNQMRHIKKLKFYAAPGSKHEYQSISTAILGVVLERAVGKSLGLYMEENIWKPLGMEYDASISLDSKKYRLSKAYGGFTMNIRDLAKIGRLYINKGDWHGHQIVDSAWIERSTHGNVANYGYQNSWYSYIERIADTLGEQQFADSTAVVNRFIELGIEENERMIHKNRETNKWRGEICTPRFFAYGMRGQVLYVNPDKNLIIVRLGENDNNADYEDIADKLSRLFTND